jgi:hypothetical protein
MQLIAPITTGKEFEALEITFAKELEHRRRASLHHLMTQKTPQMYLEVTEDYTRKATPSVATPFVTTL